MANIMENVLLRWTRTHKCRRRQLLHNKAPRPRRFKIKNQLYNLNLTKNRNIETISEENYIER